VGAGTNGPVNVLQGGQQEDLAHWQGVSMGITRDMRHGNGPVTGGMRGVGGEEARRARVGVLAVMEAERGTEGGTERGTERGNGRGEQEGTGGMALGRASGRAMKEAEPGRKGGRGRGWGRPRGQGKEREKGVGERWVRGANRGLLEQSPLSSWSAHERMRWEHRSKPRVRGRQRPRAEGFSGRARYRRGQGPRGASLFIPWSAAAGAGSRGEGPTEVGGRGEGSRGEGSREECSKREGDRGECRQKGG